MPTGPRRFDPAGDMRSIPPEFGTQPMKMGRARRGYFYTNVIEDEGSISAVVPDGSHVERLDKDTPKQMRLF